MRTTLLWMTLVYMLAIPTLALAGWTDDFLRDVDNLGLDQAIEHALDADLTPHEILIFIANNRDKFDIRMSLKALYCAGVDQEVVWEAAEELGITFEETSTALAESKRECGSKMSLSDRDILEQLPSDRDLNQPPEHESGPQQLEHVVDLGRDPGRCATGSTQAGSGDAPGDRSHPEDRGKSRVELGITIELR